MIKISAKTKYIKVVSVVLSILLVWQAVVWADPGICDKANISPRNFFELSRTDGSVVKYLIHDLDRAAAEPSLRNLGDIQAILADRVSALRSGSSVYYDILPDPEEIIKQNTVLAGEVYVDIGSCRLRYISPKIGSLELPPGYEEIDPLRDGVERSSLSGNYFVRQLLKKDPVSDGFIRKGTVAEISKAVVDKGTSFRYPDADTQTEIFIAKEDLHRRVLRSRMPGLRKNIIVDVLKSVRISDFHEFDSVIVPDGAHPEKAKAWLLDINTKTQVNSRDELYIFLSKRFGRGVVGLSSEVLDTIKARGNVLEEYLFHVLLCPRFGHEKARAIQEELFPENYTAFPGDMTRGHMDGLLSDVLRSVILEKCRRVGGQMPDPAEFNPYAEDVSKIDFTGKGPQELTKIYKELREKMRRVNRLRIQADLDIKKITGNVLKDRENILVKMFFYLKEFLTYRSTKKKIKNAAVIIDKYRIIEASYKAILLKLLWASRMEGIWAKAENEIGYVSSEEMNRSQVRKVLRTVKKVVREHGIFMKEHPWGGLLRFDAGVNNIINNFKLFIREMDPGYGSGGAIDVRDIDIVEIDDAVTGKEPVKIPVEVTGKDKGAPEKDKKDLADRVKGFLWNMRWTKLLFICSAAAMLSITIMRHLPFNTFTLVAGTAVTVFVISYLILKDFSWGNVARMLTFMAVAGVFFTVLSHFIPLPWLGLSFAVMIAGEIIWSKFAGKTARSKKEKEKKGAEENAAGKNEKVLISDDLIGPMQEVIGALRGEGGSRPMEFTGNPEKDRMTFLSNLMELRQQSEPAGPAGEHIPPGELYSQVYKAVEKMARGNSPEKKYLYMLKSWQKLEEEELVEALAEVTSEVIRSLEGTWKWDQDIPADKVCDIICVIVRMDPDVRTRVKVLMLIKQLREKSEGTLSLTAADDHFDMGKLYLSIGDIYSARKYFAKALKERAYDEEIYFALGVISHIFEDWKTAEEAYRIYVASVSVKKEMTEKQKKKVHLVMLLMDKAEKRITLSGEKKGGDEGIGDLGHPAPGALDIFRKAVSAIKGKEISYREYALRYAPWLEEIVFNIMPTFAVLAGSIFVPVSLYQYALARIAVSAFFISLHYKNLGRAPPADDSFLKKAQYAFLAPSVLSAIHLTAGLFPMYVLDVLRGASFLPRPVIIISLAFLFIYIAGMRVHLWLAETWDESNEFGPAAIGGDDPSGRREPTPIEKDFVYQTRFGPYFGDEAVAIVKDVLSGLLKKDSNVIDLMSGAHTYMPAVTGEVVGVGLNPRELAKNPALTKHIVQDLNEHAQLDILSDGAFDAVIMANGMAYLEDPGRNFKEAAKKLRPGGVLFIAFSNYYWDSSAQEKWRNLEKSAAEHVAQTRGFSHGMNYSQQGMTEAVKRRADYTMREIAAAGEFTDIKIERPGTVVSDGIWLEPLVMITAVRKDAGQIGGENEIPEASPGAERSEPEMEDLFEVRGKQFYAETITDTGRMRQTVDEWFRQRGDEWDFSREKWDSVIGLLIEDHKKEAFMVKLQTRQGELLGISLCTKITYPFYEAAREVWCGQYTEVAREMRGYGLGSILLAKRLEYILDDIDKEYARQVPGTGDEYLDVPDDLVLEHVMIVHPAEEERGPGRAKIARDFFEKRGFRELPVVWTGWADRDERLKDVYMSISEERARRVIEKVRSKKSPGKTVPEEKEGDPAYREERLFYRAPYGEDFYMTGEHLREQVSDEIAGKLKKERIVDRLAQALINMARNRKDEKVCVAVDLDLGESEVKGLFEKLAKELPGNKRELKIFLKDLVILGGKGRALSERLKRISKMSGEGDNKIDPRNIIIISDINNVDFFKEFTASTVAGINADNFDRDAYFPLLEIMLFSVGKHLGWPEAELRTFYGFIPNVLLEKELSEETALELFTKDARRFSLELISDAVPLDNDHRRELMDSLHTMLARA